nr:hypothetical protein GCM10020093_022460 [Planobispora longispora]
MSQATLRTSRIQLVPLSDDHLEHEIELDADPEVMRYLGNGRARTREEVERLHHERLAVAGLVPGLGFWAASSRDGSSAGGSWSRPSAPIRARPAGRPSSATGSCAATGARAWPARAPASSSGTGSRTSD